MLDGGDAADWMFGDTGSGVLFMVPQTSELLCLTEMCVADRKGS